MAGVTITLGSENEAQAAEEKLVNTLWVLNLPQTTLLLMSYWTLSFKRALKRFLTYCLLELHLCTRNEEW